MDAREIRHVMGHFATGVTIVTTKDKAGVPTGITANAFSSLSLDPPMVLVCIDKKANCYDCFEDSRVFAVNLLGEHQEHLANRFATKGIEKFQDTPWRMSGREIPLLDETIGHIECAVSHACDGGDHTIYLGKVLHAQAAGDRPLLFFKGRYQRLPGRD